MECIVAPYEADAQMAYLALTGDVDAVLTEDSDLLTYGCPVVSKAAQIHIFLNSSMSAMLLQHNLTCGNEQQSNLPVCLAYRPT